MTVEGYTTAHDDSHDRHELARAAACYAIGDERVFGINEHRWPWPVFPKEWRFKDKGSRRNMIVAAALLIAQIERDDRERMRLEGDSNVP